MITKSSLGGDVMGRGEDLEKLIWNFNWWKFAFDQGLKLESLGMSNPAAFLHTSQIENKSTRTVL